MPKRKPVEAGEPAPAASEAVKKTARKATAPKPKSASGKAAHKHHTKPQVDAAIEAVVTGPVAEPVTHDAIARLAYSYWDARGRQGGSPEQDWLQAERELAKLA